ncbi:MAG: hypothetical protein QXE01_03660 [Sulfolobales archaeon]
MSYAARKGFSIERLIVNHINNKTGVGSKLIECISSILNVSCRKYSAEQLYRKKADLKIICDDNEILVSVKSYNPEADYNHVERKFVEEYRRRWGIPENVYVALKMYVGEVNRDGKPISQDEIRREAESISIDDFINEAQQRVEQGLLSQSEYESIHNEVKKKGITPGLLGKMRRIRFDKLRNYQDIIEWFRRMKNDIIRDVLIDNEPIKIFIVVERSVYENLEKLCYYVAKSDKVIEVYSQGDVRITGEGNLLIGEVELQRKGGDRWRGEKWEDVVANQLQFKIRPSKIREIAEFVACEELKKRDIITLNKFFKKG